jgi:type IV secretory pathway protease TraF
MTKNEQKKVVSLVKQRLGLQENEFPVVAKQMVIGYLIANSSLTLGQIGVVVDLTSQDSIFKMFRQHKYDRDNNADYKSRYYGICSAMGIKNRL